MFDKNKRFDQEIEQEFTEGEVIVREGDESRELYVVQTGAAEVTKRVGKKEITLTTLRKGDFFGEMSLLEGTLRSATVRAVERTKVLVIKPGGLLLKMRRDPTFAFEMLQQLSTRIRRMDEELSAALADGKLSSDAFGKIVNESNFKVAGGLEADED